MLSYYYAVIESFREHKPHPKQLIRQNSYNCHYPTVVEIPLQIPGCDPDQRQI